MLPLLTEILASKPTGVILTTYALSPAFFEYKVVNPLLAAGCEHIVLFVDRHGYNAMVGERAALTRAGVDYWVIPVDLAPFVFHAKLSLMWSRTEVRLYVSSANLTKGGLGSNLEVADRLICRNGDTWAGPQIREAIRVLRALINKQPISDPARSGLNEVVGHCSTALSSLRFGGHVPGGGEVHLLHSLEQSLFDQFSGLISFQPDEIAAVSPFFDADLSAVSTFANRFPKARIVVAQGPDSAAINPKVGGALPARISPASLKGTAKRFVHAKVLLAKGAEGSVLVSGSPNLTSAAWEHNSTKGNFEAAIARVSSQRDAFGQLFAGNIQISPTKWNRLAFRQPKAPSHSAQPRIVWAELSGSHLRVRLAGIELTAIPSPAEMEISTRDGLFRVSSCGAPEPAGEIVVVNAHVPPACMTALGSTASVAVRLSKGSDNQFVWVKAILVVPEDIGSSPAFKRARQAYNRIQQGDPETDDLLALLAFVQSELTAALSGASQTANHEDGRHESRKDTPPAGSDASGPGVFLAEEESFDATRHLGQPRGLLSLLDEVPRLFRALLQDGSGRTPTLPRPTEPYDGEPDENEKPPSEDETPDSDAVSLGVIETLDWVADRFESEDGAGSHFEAMTYLLDLGLSVARFFYLAWHTGVDRDSGPSRAYATYIRRILTDALSASGSLQGEPKGCFLRMAAPKNDHRRDSLKRRGLPGRLLYHICELCAFDWEDQPQSLREIRYILTGAEEVLGQQLETVDASTTTAAELASDSANVFAPGITADSMRVEVAKLRSLETPEEVAKRRFRPLLNLRDASRRCIDLKHQIASLKVKTRMLLAPSTHWRSKQDLLQRLSSLQEQIRPLETTLSEAESERTAIREECARDHPDEMLRYDGFYQRGEWRFIDYLPASETPSCPRERVQLPGVIVSQLSDITRPVQCLSCSVLIIPFAEGTLDVA